MRSKKQKYITYFLLVFLTTFIAGKQCFSMENGYNKDPFIAGVLSFMWTGAGHIYAGNYKKGTFFLTLDLLQKAALVYLLVNLNDRYTRDDDIVSWQELNIVDRTAFISIIMSFIVVKIWDTYTAVEWVKKQQNGLKLGLGTKNTYVEFSKRF